MSDSVKTGLLAAYSKLLRPLVRILLRHGVTYAEFSEVVKTVFVTIAAQEFRVPGKKMSKARIAIVTGLTRKEVQRLSSTDQEERFSLKTNLSRIGRVLSGWHTDPDFTGPYGMPLEIRYDSDVPNDATFSRLVQQYSGDMTPRAMLDELLRVGAVVETDQNWFKAIRREYVPHTLAPDFLERVGRGVHDFIHTVEENMQKKSGEAGRFERTVRPAGGLRAQDLPLFDAYVREKCQALLEDIDNWLTKLEQPNVKRGDKAVQTGVGIYHFIVKDEFEQKHIKELLESRSDSE
jgi:Family of unknown function (DUF6502)